MCSYCGCQSIAVVGRFMAEHEAIINASGQLRRACEAGDSGLARPAAQHLAALLSPHADAEEAGIFTVLAQDSEFTDHVTMLCGEHRQLDASLAAIAAGDHPAYPAFESMLRAHIDKEENGLFPAAAIAFAGPEWERVEALTPPA